MENGLLNVRKTARLLDIHPNTLRSWTNQGLLPCYTVNARGDRRFRREDIEEFLSRRRFPRCGPPDEVYQELEAPQHCEIA